MLGPIALSEGPAAAVRAQQLGIPIVSLSRAEGLTQLGEYVFRDMPTNSAQAKAVAQYAQKKLGAKVSFKGTARKGRIQIEYATLDELNRILAAILDG